MLELRKGDIFESGCEAIVNATNTVGVMGAGLAKQFADRFPKMFIEYRSHCVNGLLQPGGIHMYECHDEDSKGGLKWIINFATKAHFKNPSQYEWIVNGMNLLRLYMERHKIKSVAIPAIGCGLGNLSFDLVRDYITVYDKMFFGGVKLLLYEPRE